MLKSQSGVGFFRHSGLPKDELFTIICDASRLDDDKKNGSTSFRHLHIAVVGRAELSFRLPDSADRRKWRKPLFDGGRRRRLLSDSGRWQRITLVKVNRIAFHFGTVSLLLFSHVAFRGTEP
jgi:hypothetical protein